MKYQVFLSHNSQDKPFVRALADWLKKHSISYFLDEQDLGPGDIISVALEKALNESESAVICIGQEGEGPWQSEEVHTLLNRAIAVSREKNEFRIIPVLLPDADTSKLRWFLQTRLWCDLSKGITDSEPELLRLKSAILGERYDRKLAADLGVNPYRGLEAFNAQDADFFFGRAVESVELATKVRDWRFACVVGPSGNGKSSLACAGLASEAAKQVVPGIETWPRLIVRPGNDLLHSILKQLFSKASSEQRGTLVSQAMERIAPVAHPLTAENWADGLNRELQSFYCVDERGYEQPVVILIDQFEEIFTHRGIVSAMEEQRMENIRRVLDALALLSQRGSKRWHFVLTLRSDFLQRCRLSLTFWNLLEKEQLKIELDELNEEGWRAAIKGPAARAGAYLEAGLVEIMLKDVYRQRGSMPLLQLALQQLWQNRNGACLAHQAYIAIGGVANALQQRAEQTLSQLKQDDPEYWEIARNLFLRLTSLGEGVSDTRRRVDRRELDWEGTDAAKVDHVIAVLSDADNRLIVTDEEAVEVTHEVLIRDCPTIRGWLELARPEIPVLRRLTHAARRWDENGRAPIFLNAADPPRELKRWMQSTSLRLTHLEREYWRASRAERAHAHREKRLTRQKLLREQLSRTADAIRAKQRFQRIATTAVVLALVAFVAAWFGVKSARTAKRNEQTANNHLAAAHFAVGRIDFERGNLTGALHWWMNAYLTADDPMMQTSMRNLIGGWSPQVGSPLLHDGHIMAVAFSPDGATVLTGSDDNTARLWDAKTGTLRGEPLKHERSVSTVAFSPDGVMVLTGSDDNTARLWDAKTGEPRGEPLKHEDWVRTVAFSPDGTTVLTGSYDNTARLWDAKTGAPRVDPLKHEGPVWAVASSPDGATVLTGSDDNTARLWDAKTGAPRGKPLKHEDWVRTVDFSPDGTTVLTGSYDNTARLWDAKTGEPRGEPLKHEDQVQTVTFSPDGTTVLTGSDDNTARLWDAKTGAERVEPLKHEGPVWAVTFSPDGATVLTGNYDNTARLWDANIGVPRGEPLEHEGPVWAVAFSPDGATVLTGSGDNTARLWDAKMGSPRGEPLKHDGPVWAVAFSPDGTSVLTGSYDNTARLWDAKTGEPRVEPLKHEGPVLAAAFSPNGATVLTGGGDNTARLWDAKTGASRGEPLKHEGPVWVVAFSPDGATVLTGSYDNTARLWDAKTGEPRVEPLKHEGPVLAVAFSPDGATVLTGGDDNMARLWDAKTGVPRGEPLKHEHRVRTVAFSPDSTTVLTGGGDNTARLWNAKTGAERGEPLKHEDWVRTVAFSPDGTTVLTGSNDNTARLWDAKTGAPRVESLKHEGPVLAVAFSSDGEMVVTGSSDFMARLWDVPPPALKDPERLRLSIEVRTRWTLSEQGLMRRLTQTEWLERKQRLAKLGGPSDTPTWEQYREQ